MNNHPIGIFDSGVGGLSVWREIRKALPREPLIYFGDGLNCPYGGRTTEEVKTLTFNAVEWLLKEGAKMIVLACNTATAAALESLREKFAGVPIVGMVPAVKPAAAATKTGTVAVLATAGALHGGQLERYIRDFAAGVQVVAAEGTGFVELVEAGLEGSEQAVEAVRTVVEPLIARGADRIVLGCTHYPFLRGALQTVIGGRAVEIVDPAPAIARRAVQLLAEHDLAAPPSATPAYRFHTLAGEEYLRKLQERAMNRK